MPSRQDPLPAPRVAQANGRTGGSGEPTSQTCTAEDVAIVGMACRFAGDVDSPSALWELLERNQSGQGDVPSDRFNVDSFYHPDQKRPGSIQVRGGYWIKDDIRRFDPGFFGIRAPEATSMDPLQRKLLEAAYDSLESSGTRLEDVSGSNAGVYIARFTDDWTSMLSRDAEYQLDYQHVGTSAAVQSNRISYCFNLKGPSLTLDTACSGSMYAVHAACNAIQQGECDTAFVGGANLTLTPDMTILVSQAGMLSPSSKVNAFDAAADGYARGDGIAMLYLKKLSAAIRDNDPIRGVIRGTAVTANGRTAGITHPSLEGQRNTIVRAYAKAGLHPKDTCYVECHGTGTGVGDPVEVSALADVFLEGRPRETPLLIGSVKPSIGHTEAASGIASIIKVALALENGVIPATIGIERLSPKIDWHDGMLKAVSENTPFPPHSVRRAGVNSFGFGGANAHAILEATNSVLPGYSRSRPWTTRRDQKHSEPGIAQTPSNNGLNGTEIQPTVSVNQTNGHDQADEYMKFNGHALQQIAHVDGKNKLNGYIAVYTSEDKNASSTTDVSLATRRSKLLLVASGQDEQALEGNAATIRDALKLYEPLDLAHTLAVRRSHFVHRSFAVAGNGTLTENAFGLKGRRPIRAPRIGFAFTGQGAQWPSMGKSLLQEYSSFRQTISQLDAVLAALPNGFAPSWSLIDALAGCESIDIHDAKVSQPLTTAVQIGLVKLLRSWDICPVATVGHSSGEIAAAFAAGLLSDYHAIILAHMRGIAAGKASEDGAMLAVGLGAHDLTPYESIYAPDVTIACVNSPQSVTMSGKSEAISSLETLLTGYGIFARRLKTGGKAYHSSHMKEVGEDYENDSRTALASLTAEASVLPKIPMVSSVTGKFVTDSTLDTSYWRSNLESPVLFAPAVKNLIEDADLKIDVVLELGPHAALAGPLRQTFSASKPASGDSIRYLSTLKRGENEVESLLNLAGQLFLLNSAVDLGRINSCERLVAGQGGDILASKIKASYGRTIVDLPRYSFNYSTMYWAESRNSKEWRFRKHPRHDVLGSQIPGTTENPRIWRNVLRVKDLPWLADHKVGESIVFPAAGYIAMAAEAVTQVTEDRHSGDSSIIKGYEFTDFVVKAAMTLSEDSGTEVLFDLRALDWTTAARSETTFQFTVSSIVSQQWSDHATGTVTIQHTPEDPSKALYVYASAPLRLLSSSKYYRRLKELGLEYGPVFAVLSNLGQDPTSGFASGTTTLRPTNAIAESRYVVHPVTIDTCLQTAIAAAWAGDEKQRGRVFVPVNIERLVMQPCSKTQTSHSAHVQAKARTTGLRSIGIDATLCSSSGVQILSMKNGRALTIDVGEQAASSERHPYYRMEWVPDADFLRQDQIQRLYPSGSSDSDIERKFDLLERLTLLCMVQTTVKIPHLLDTEKVPNGHLRRFGRWISEHVQMLRESKYRDAVGRGILDADSQQREAEIVALTEELDAVDVVDARAVRRIYDHIHEILEGERQTIDVLTQDNAWSEFHKNGIVYRSSYVQFERTVSLLAHKNPRMKILEIGAGSGGTTRHALSALQGASSFRRYGSYTFTDLSYGFLSAAAEEFKECSNVIYKILDIEKDPAEQGFPLEEYDLIVAANVLHATQSLVKSLKNAKSLLKPNGRILLVETTKEELEMPFGGWVLGGLSGWWLGEQDGRLETALATKERWRQSLKEAGFCTDTIMLDDYPGAASTTTNILAKNQPIISLSLSAPKPEFFIICKQSISGTAQALDAMIRKAGFEVKHKLLSDSKTVSSSATVILLTDVEAPLLVDLQETELSALQSIAKSTTHMFWITAGGLYAPVKPEHGMSAGMARVLRLEYPSLNLHTLDLWPRKDPEGALERLWEVVRSLRFSSEEIKDFDRVEKDEVIYIERMKPDERLNKEYLTLDSNSLVADESVLFHEKESLELGIERVGQFDSIHFTECTRPVELDDGFVEIHVEAVGVNMKDVVNLMGTVDQTYMSLEAAGIVTRIGPGVTRVQPGDKVVCVGEGNYGTYMYAHESGCVATGENSSLKEMSTMPVVFCTVIYSLLTLGRLKRGESVLINAAAGGVGIAAIQVAHMVGAKVYATVSTVEKRQFLREKFGIPGGCIFNSRETTFYDDLMTATGGRGVDVVLNSTINELLHTSVKCLSKFGRHVDIGKRDIIDGGRLSLGLLNGSRSFSTFYLMDLLEPEFRDQLAHTLDEMVDLYNRRKIRPLNPLTEYDIGEFEKAMRYFMTGKHMGKIVITYTNPDSVVRVRPTKKEFKLRKDGAYLLVGCLGGLGRSLAFRMLDRGARNLTFLSRSGVDDPKAATLVSDLRNNGANVEVVRGDVSNSEDVDRAVGSTKAPIAGVVNAAMVLSDKIFAEMTVQDFQLTAAPKVQGSINLHNALRKYKQDPDFFVMTSSISGVAGVFGQPNYAAVNAFLDCFARHRHSIGLPATSVNVGRVLDVGYVAERPGTATYLQQHGLYGIEEEDMLRALEVAMENPRPQQPTAGLAENGLSAAQIATGFEPLKLKEALVGGEIGQNRIGARDIRLGLIFAALNDVDQNNARAKAEGLTLKQAMENCDKAEAVEVVKKATVEKFAGFLECDPDEIDADKPVSAYGMDSMLAAELRGWLFRQVGVNVPLLKILSSIFTIKEMAELAVEGHEHEKTDRA